MWQGRHPLRRKSNDIGIDESALKPSELAEYDRGCNPWEDHGLNLLDINSKGYRMIEEVLSNVPPIDYPDGVLDVVLEDADDWE